MKKKGFTLIELLSTIIILAVISLIAIPMVLGIIENIRKKVAVNSAYNYIDAVEKYMVLHQIDSINYPYEFKEGEKYYISDEAKEEYALSFFIEKVYAKELNEGIYVNDIVKVKGTNPVSGYLLIGAQNKVKEAVLALGDAEVACEMETGMECVYIGKYSNEHVRNLELSVENSLLKVGESIQIKATTDPEGSTVRWTSSNSNIATVDNKGIVKGISEGKVTIKAKAGKLEKEITMEIYEPNDSILGYIREHDFNNDEVVTINVLEGQTKEEVVEEKNYTAHVYTFNGNQTWDSEMVFGDASDVATASTNAQNMVIVKVNGDLTINSGVTVRPYYDTTYGGPKGFLLYVTGKLTNNGTIDNSHGAKAEGENVYLWKNSDGTYEYVPAIGGTGGKIVSTYKAGENGTNGADRSTGGGSSGAVYNYSATSYGGNGTSYSGGVGGGAIYEINMTLPTISNIGGQANYGCSSGFSNYAGGGAGNPGGIGGYQNTYPNRCNNNSSYKGENGTGGLLIIYSDEYENNGTISAHGYKGGAGVAGGGSSGGGSINIFTKEEIISKGSINVNGGASVGSKLAGGTGGSGTVTYTQLNK